MACVTDGVADETYPDRDQMAAAESKPVEEVNCSQLSDDMSQFGEPGSPTWVQDIRLVEPNRLSVTIQDETPEEAARQMAQGLRERLDELAAQSAGGDAPAATARYADGRERSIWVVADTFQGSPLHVTLEMLGKARELTAVTRSEVAAVAISPQASEMAQELASFGADRVLLLDNSSLGPVYSRAVSEALAGAIDRERPLRRAVRRQRRRQGLGRPHRRPPKAGADRRCRRPGDRR